MYLYIEGKNKLQRILQINFINEPLNLSVFLLSIILPATRKIFNTLQTRTVCVFKKNCFENQKM